MAHKWHGNCFEAGFSAGWHGSCGMVRCCLENVLPTRKEGNRGSFPHLTKGAAYFANVVRGSSWPHAPACKNHDRLQAGMALSCLLPPNSNCRATYVPWVTKSENRTMPSENNSPATPTPPASAFRRPRAARAWRRPYKDHFFYSFIDCGGLFTSPERAECGRWVGCGWLWPCVDMPVAWLYLAAVLPPQNWADSVVRRLDLVHLAEVWTLNKPLPVDNSVDNLWKRIHAAIQLH